MPKEQWRPVVDFEDSYLVSDRGRVRSVSRKVRYRDGRIRYYPSSIRKLHIVGGYLAVDLKSHGRKKTIFVHQIVAQSFIGPRPKGKQVAHRDGNGLNPALMNLRYATPKENDSDKILHGTRMVGIKHGNAKLTELDILKIRDKAANRERQRAIAADFGITQSQVSRIVTGKRWSHL